jgi:hypothetical protein
VSELVLTVRERPDTVYVATATNAPTGVATGHSAAFVVSLDKARTTARREQIAKGHDPVVPAREPLLRGSNRAMAKAYGISAERVSEDQSRVTNKTPKDGISK